MQTLSFRPLGQLSVEVVVQLTLILWLCGCGTPLELCNGSFAFIGCRSRCADSQLRVVGAAALPLNFAVAALHILVVEIVVQTLSFGSSGQLRSP